MKKITVQVNVNADPEKVWDCWTNPVHICSWNFANDDWHCPKAENDLRKGGRFVYTMAAKDGSFSFDFSGQYTQVETKSKIVYKMDDGREAVIEFIPVTGGINVKESFDPETMNPEEMQQQGWQAILNNFKKRAESI